MNKLNIEFLARIQGGQHSRDPDLPQRAQSVNQPASKPKITPHSCFR
ncbi:MULTISPECIES: hypothetical protein [Pseudoalteromonas]|uniref:Uncharacterized protein n=1 Tax=Pseudoalteromonas luteoviolacea (strain 2ta16) TaxID=1353533 RepID=V4JC87_PSEL2|nr:MULTISPECIES: hypothetical protein [Pseudoalteromonas]ESP92732.1 hypothetical protein PL2TA16_03930 [Pseudoalteromonas luteoviolacea 2ta16]KZN35543.1 hypothetical protein N483_00895 [Pseudoalteromonas luteoviolacea NCIMB 1944]MCG7546488.1 hypothetical protein [Pseudoalteromonas sp. Of7M-16]